MSYTYNCRCNTYVLHIYLNMFTYNTYVTHMWFRYSGIPVFKDKHAGSVIIGALRQANLPDELSKQFAQVYCCFLYPCRFWVIDPKTNQPVSETHKPSDLGPLMVMLVNSMLHWYDGKMVTDHSRIQGDPSRYFLLRAMLLFWCGDYPGLGEASNCGHASASPAACHWCNYRGEYSKGLSRTLFKHFRRWLDLADPLRTDPRFGPPEMRGPPSLTTMAEYLAAVIATESCLLAWKHKDHPRKASGVNGWCPLSACPLWNMLSDFLPDLMHIVKNWHERTMLHLLQGKRTPKRNPNYNAPKRGNLSRAVHQEKKQEYKREEERYIICSYHMYMQHICYTYS